MTARNTVETLSIPESIKQALARLIEDLKRVAGDNFASLAVYGGVARGSYQAGKSDINIVILIHDAAAEKLDELAPVLKEAWRNIAIDTMILTPAEVNTSADAFPVKFLNIKEFHRVLHGEDYFKDIKVEKEHIRLRLEQELRNLSLRLRKRYIAASTDPVVTIRIIREAAAPLAVLLRTLLSLNNSPVAEDNSTSANFEAAAEVFGFDKEALLLSASLRHDGKCNVPAVALYGRIMKVVDKAVDIVNDLETVS